MTHSELNRLVQHYQAGATVYELATEFGIHRGTVAKHLKHALQAWVLAGRVRACCRNWKTAVPDAGAEDLRREVETKAR